MKKVERYFYPAIFTYEPDQEIAVTFPDLDCATSGENEDDALLSARELLGCVLNGLEEDEKEIPTPTPLPQVVIAPNERAVLIIERNLFWINILFSYLYSDSLLVEFLKQYLYICKFFYISLLLKIVSFL